MSQPRKAPSIKIKLMIEKRFKYCGEFLTIKILIKFPNDLAPKIAKYTMVHMKMGIPQSASDPKCIISIRISTSNSKSI